MDKRMIEEMAKVVQRNMCGDRPCEECNYHGFKTKILPRYCEVYLIAEKLYNAGYRKVCEPAIKNGEVIGFVNGADYVPKNLFLFGISNTRKETAGKFAERVKMAFYCHFDELIPSIMADKIDEIAKEITEGKANASKTKF